MPNFTARPTSGVTVEPWGDPLVGEHASRINPSTIAPHRHWVVAAGTQVVVAATVDGGAEAALDGTLGGNLFHAWLAEKPKHRGIFPLVTSPGGQSSVQRFTPRRPGHYTLVMRRPSGGAVILHFDVEPPP